MAMMEEMAIVGVQRIAIFALVALEEWMEATDNTLQTAAGAKAQDLMSALFL